MSYEVGKFYKVRCVELVNMSGDVIGTVPIIGEKHADPQFGSKIPHYHIDGRFVREDSIIFHKNGKTNSVVWAGDFAPETYWFSYKAGNIVYRRMKCKRATTGIIPPEGNSKYKNWYDSFVGKSCKGKKCPHLGQEMIEENGVLVCPLHNLKGCAEKEVIIPF